MEDSITSRDDGMINEINLIVPKIEELYMILTIDYLSIVSNSNNQHDLTCRYINRTDKNTLLENAFKAAPVNTDVIDKARTKFALSATKGIAYLVKQKIIEDDPQDIANFLMHCSFFDKRQIGEYLTEPCNKIVLDHYLEYLSIAGMGLEGALRKFLCKFKLPGEAQKIDRVIEAFARSYCKLNPEVFADSDAAYILCFSMILLNTDLHNPSNPSIITKEAFINGIKETDTYKDNLSVALLSQIYDSIKKEELTTENEELIEYALSSSDIEGMLWKKSDRANFYSWNRRWCVVANGCLYYFYSKKDKSPRGVIPLEDLIVSPLNRKGRFRFQITAAEITINDQDNTSSHELSTTSRVQITTYSQLALSLDETNQLSGVSIISSRSNTRRLSAPLIKSAKFVSGQLVEGRRNRYIFQCSTEEERDRWVNILNRQMRSQTLTIIGPENGYDG